MTVPFNETEFIKELTDYINSEDEANCGITAEEVNNNTFAIKTLDQADYMLRRVNEQRAEVQRIVETGKRKKEEYNEKVDRFVESNTSGLLSSISYLESLLKTFTEDYVADKRVKSIKLPEGTLSIKKQPLKYVYDDKVLLPWLQENAESLITKTEVSKINKDLLKKSAEICENKIKINGVTVEGVDILEVEPTFKATPTI